MQRRDRAYFNSLLGVLETAVDRMVHDGKLGTKETTAILALNPGNSYDAIGTLMHISTSTVAKYVKSAYRKLDAHSALELVNRYLIEPSLREGDDENSVNGQLDVYP